MFQAVEKMDDLELVVVLFGDDYKRIHDAKGATDDEIKKIEDDIKEKFCELCLAIDRDEWKDLGTTYQKKKEKTLIKCQQGLSESEEIKRLVSEWKKVEKPEKESEQKKNNAILHDPSLPKKLGEEIGMQTGDVVALDICLLYDDYKRCTEQLPVLSMAWHHYLESECDCKCFLYSRMSVNAEAKSNWIKVYKEEFTPEKLPEIHSRFNVK